MLVATLLSLSALAQPAPEIRYQDVTEVDFNAVDVQATVERPDVSYIPGTPSIEFHPLFRPRRNFSDEMTRSVAEVR